MRLRACSHHGTQPNGSRSAHQPEGGYQKRTDSISLGAGRVEQPGERAILRAAHPRARVRISEGSHQVASRKATNVDFPGSESDDLRAVARATHVEGRTHGDARGRQSATCAAVGAERATGFQERVRPVAVERLGGCRIPKLFFTRSLGRSRSEPVGESEDSGHRVTARV